MSVLATIDAIVWLLVGHAAKSFLNAGSGQGERYVVWMKKIAIRRVSNASANDAPAQRMSVVRPAGTLGSSRPPSSSLTSETNANANLLRTPCVQEREVWLESPCRPCVFELHFANSPAPGSRRRRKPAAATLRAHSRTLPQAAVLALPPTRAEEHAREWPKWDRCLRFPLSIVDGRG